LGFKCREWKIQVSVSIDLNHSLHCAVSYCTVFAHSPAVMLDISVGAGGWVPSVQSERQK
jgi:hypothetical protein